MRLSIVECGTLWVYGMLMRLAHPLLRRKLRKRALLEPGYAHDVDARFGRYEPQTPGTATQADDAGGLAPLIWVHAVSLGETRAAAILIEALRHRLPAMRLLLTHSTATGHAEGAKLLRANDMQTWLPWDDPASVERFLNRFQPAAGVLMETEVWPVLIHACRRRGVPLALANARLNEKSSTRAARLAWLSRPAYAGLAAIWAQTNADAQRLTPLGAHVNVVTGNLKFDAKPDAAQCVQATVWRRQLTTPVVMLASSREGEELAFIKLFCDLSLYLKENIAMHSGVESVRCLIVPRHPQRFDVVADLLRAQGCVVRRRSEWGHELDRLMAEGQGATHCMRGAEGLVANPVDAAHSNQSASGATAQAAGATVVWLGDSLGEMALYYSLADVALLGGSFEPLGGQNLIEAAACGCPLVVGPHTFNFADAAERAVEMGAAIRVDDMQAAVAAAGALVADNGRHASAVAAARAFAASQQGAAAAMAEAFVQLLPLRG